MKYKDKTKLATLLELDDPQKAERVGLGECDEEVT